MGDSKYKQPLWQLGEDERAPPSPTRTRGKDKGNRASKWWEPSMSTATGEPAFALKSMCKNPEANYDREIKRWGTTISNDLGQPVPAMKLTGCASNLTRGLLGRKTLSTKKEWESLLHNCPFKSIVEEISVDNLQTKAHEVEQWARDKLFDLRKDSKTISPHREQAHYLRSYNASQANCYLREHPLEPCYDTIKDLYKCDRGTHSHHYTATYDYSDMAKNHMECSNLFWAENFGTDDAPDLKVMLYPLPVMYADYNPLTKNYTHRDAIRSGINYIHTLETMLCSRAVVKNCMFKPDVNWRDIDAGFWDPSRTLDEHGQMKTQLHLLCDQASCETRLWQQLFTFFPGVYKLPHGHRISNNMKNVCPKLEESSKCWRAFCRGPKGKCANQGRYKNTTRNLIKEAKEDPTITAMRPGAYELVAKKQKEVAECLEERSDFVFLWMVDSGTTK
eukprot:g16512.t1